MAHKTDHSKMKYGQLIAEKNRLVKMREDWWPTGPGASGLPNDRRRKTGILDNKRGRATFTARMTKASMHDNVMVHGGLTDNSRTMRSLNANIDFWKEQFKRYRRQDGNQLYVDPSVIARRSESRKKRLKGDAGRRYKQGAVSGVGPLATGSLTAGSVV